MAVTANTNCVQCNSSVRINYLFVSCKIRVMTSSLFVGTRTKMECELSFCQHSVTGQQHVFEMVNICAVCLTEWQSKSRRLNSYCNNSHNNCRALCSIQIRSLVMQSSQQFEIESSTGDFCNPLHLTRKLNLLSYSWPDYWLNTRKILWLARKLALLIDFPGLYWLKSAFRARPRSYGNPFCPWWVTECVGFGQIMDLQIGFPPHLRVRAHEVWLNKFPWMFWHQWTAFGKSVIFTGHHHWPSATFACLLLMTNLFQWAQKFPSSGFAHNSQVAGRPESTVHYHKIFIRKEMRR